MKLVFTADIAEYTQLSPIDREKKIHDVELWDKLPNGECLNGGLFIDFISAKKHRYYLDTTTFCGQNQEFINYIEIAKKMARPFLRDIKIDSILE